MQRSILTRIANFEVTLTYLLGLSWKLAWMGYLIRWRCCKSFIPFGNTKMGLSPQCFILIRILEKLHRANGIIYWAKIWWREFIYIGGDLGKSSSILEQDKIYLLHKLKIWTENKNCSCAHIDQWNDLNFGGANNLGYMEKFHPIWKLWRYFLHQVAIWSETLKNCTGS